MMKTVVLQYQYQQRTGKCQNTAINDFDLISAVTDLNNKLNASCFNIANNNQKDLH